MRAVIYVSIFFLVVSCQTKQREGSAMSSFVDEYFDALFEWSPSTGTSIGFHQYDSKMEDFSQKNSCAPTAASSPLSESSLAAGSNAPMRQ